MGRKAYVGLDLIRFAAAAAVLVFHLGYLSWADPSSTPGRIGTGLRFEGLAPGAWFGWVGVHVFFVLSGFVIAYSAEGAGPATFLKRRALRLYPAALVCSAITAAVLVALGSPLADVASRLLASAALYPMGPWVDGVYWTLGIEMTFYAAILCLLWLRAFDRLALLGCGLALCSAAFLIVGRARPGLLDGVNARYLELALLPDGCFFSVGVLLWVWARGKLTRSGAVGLGVALATGAANIYVIALGKQALPGAGAPIVPVLVWMGAVAGVVACIRWNDALWSPRRAALARTIGLATYPLYLVHDVVGAAIMRALKAPPLVALVLASGLVVALSFAVSLWAEPAIRLVLRRRWPGQSDGQSTVSLSTPSARAATPPAGSGNG